MSKIFQHELPELGKFTCIYITKLEDLKGVEVDNYLKQSKSFSIDTETTGLDCINDRIRLLQVGINNRNLENYLILILDLFSLREEAALAGEDASGRSLPKSVRDGILSFLGDERPKIAHNWAFDFSFLYYELGEFALKGKLWDTFILSKIDTNGLINVYNSLEAATKRYLKINIDKTEQKSDWSGDITASQLKYAAIDVFVLKPLCSFLWAKLVNEKLDSIVNLELDLIPIVAGSTIHGWPFDKKAAQESLEILTKEKEIALKEFLDYLDNELPEDNKLPRDADGSYNLRPKNTGRGKDKLLAGFNPGSSKQVGELFVKCGIPLALTSKGSFSVDQVSLSFIRPDYKLVDLYLKFKKSNTAISQCEKLIEKAIRHKGQDVITFSLNQLGTNTGRFSCSDPNLQQVPRSKLFRKLFVARPGYKLVVADYSGMELRMCAELAPVDTMLQAFALEEDLHKKTACAITSKKADQITKEERTAGKIINFALIYGGGAGALQRQAASGYDVIWSMKQAEEYRSRFFNLYPELNYWHDRIKGICNDPRKTAVFTRYGRRRYLIGSAASDTEDDSGRGSIPLDRLTVRANTTVQGSSADVVKLAILNINKKLPYAIGPIENCDIRFVCQVHDELVFEVKEELAEAYKDIIAKTMVESGNEICKRVTLEVEAGIGYNWGEAK